MSTLKRTPEQNTNLLIVVLLLIFFICLLPYLFYLTYPQIDKYFCLYKVGDRLGIQGNDAAISEYIINKIKPGMTEKQILQKFEEIGSIEKVNEGTNTDNLIMKNYDLHICSIPPHYLSFRLFFTQEGILNEIITLFSES